MIESMDDYFDTTDVKSANVVWHILKHEWDVPLPTREFYRNSDDFNGNRCKDKTKQWLFNTFLKKTRDPDNY